MKADLRSNAEWRSFWTGEYEPETMRLLCAYLKPGAVVLDVGANVGFYSIGLGRRLQRMGGKLFAIEPVQSNFDRLTQMIALNGVQDTVIPVNVALGNAEADVALCREAETGAVTGNAILLVGEDDRTPNAFARLTRLDTLAQELPITACHLIKIDVEGAELDLLRGGAAFLQQHRPVICMEFNTVCMKQFGYTFEDVAALVRPWGYRLYRENKAGGLNRATFIEAEGLVSDLENLFLLPKHVETEMVHREQRIEGKRAEGKSSFLFQTTAEPYLRRARVLSGEQMAMHIPAEVGPGNASGDGVIECVPVYLSRLAVVCYQMMEQRAFLQTIRAGSIVPHSRLL
jgi:FkbM family methyltransferase